MGTLGAIFSRSSHVGVAGLLSRSSHAHTSSLFISDGYCGGRTFESFDTANENVIVLNGDAEILASIRSMLSGSRILEANSYDEAVDLMLEHEIGVIISNLDDDHESTLEFFSLLKNEHPQIVSVLLANTADSTTLVHLINHARVFRYMFKPIRENLMKRYLK